MLSKLLSSQLVFVGYGVGSQSFDSVYAGTSRERWGEAAPDDDEGCPLNADCNGVPGGDDSMGGGGARGPTSLLNRMDGFHNDQHWRTNTIWVTH